MERFGRTLEDTIISSMKNSSGFSERLNLCLDKEGFPPKHRGRIQLLAEMVGLTHRGASKWVNGESSPPMSKYEAIAKKLNVNALWLRTGEGSMLDLPNDTEPSKAATFLLDINIYDESTLLCPEKKVLDTLKCTLPFKDEFFGIALQTEAMSPRFPKGSIIIFNEKPPKDGDFVLIDYDGLPNVIFRQMLVVGETIYLNAHNPKFERLVLHDKRKIIGKLVQAILSFD